MTLIRKPQIESFTRDYWEASTHFIGSTDFPEIPFISSPVGTGAGVSSLSGEVGSPGIIRLTTGSATNGSMTLRSPSSLILPSATFTLTCRFRIPVLPTAANQFVVIMGFGEGLAGGASDELTSGLYAYADIDRHCYTCTKQTGQAASYGVVSGAPTTNWRSLVIRTQSALNNTIFSLDSDSDSLAAIPTNAMGISFNIFKFNNTSTIASVLDLDFLRLQLE